ncbi:ras-specific guanine nucleotide-releasing factor 1-like isoform X2 [Brevipalpus obovatus]|uniref:ras-specific guanine nucleotide-releasing factor 1-like isoform X2 n=1 Tax=Brevipalpus obovatus TaxID=246614 RepID=UPI003D9EC2E7
MQRLRMNEIQLYALAEKAVNDIANQRGWLFKRTDSNKWQLRFFVLYQNLFFYFENETSNRPTGLILLEGSYCNKVIQPSNKNCSYSQHIFQITFLKEGSKQYEFKSETESECNAWVHSIDCASFSKMLLLKEELEQKHLHLVQIVESEKTAKSHYTQQCEELTVEIKKLRSEQMHDEVSETENIRKNLAIERIIIGGCDILLDVNQVFVRQGALLHLQSTEKHKHQRTRLGSFRGDRDVVRQCFLFTNHMLMCTRASNGKLHLAEHVGKIPLSEGTLIEDPNEQFQFIVDEPEGSMSVMGSAHGLEKAIGTSVAFSGISTGKECGGLDFKFIWDCKTGPPIVIHLVAPTLQEKAAWTSDISQCIDNVHFNDLFHSTMSDSSSVTMPQSIRNDPRLYKDDVDIRFSRTLNSCKLPQIRYASPERLFERLTDLRFLSIDFLNTFLLTYRVFTDGVTVLEALKKVHYSPESQISSMISPLHDSSGSLEEINCKNEHQPGEGINFDYDYSRRISATSMMSDMSDAHRESVVSTTSDTQLLANLQQAQQQISARNNQHWRLSYRKFEEEQAKERYLKRFGDRPESDNSGHSELLLSPGPDLTLPVPPPSPELPGTQINTRELGDDLEKTELSSDDSTSDCTASDNDSEDSEALRANGNTLIVPVHSQSSDTLKAEQSSPNSPSVLSSATSSATLVGSDSKSVSPVLKDAPEELPTVRSHISEKSASLDSKEKTQSQSLSILDSPLKSSSHGQQIQQQQRTTESVPKTVPQESSKIASMSTYREVSFEPDLVTQSSSTSSSSSAPTFAPTFPTISNRVSSGSQPKVTGSRFSAGNHLVPLPASANFLRVKTSSSKRGSSDNVYTTSESTGYTSSSTTPRSSFQTESTVLSTPRSSFQLPESPQMSSKAGVVVTSSRASTRRSSTASAASAFAVATAASSNPPDPGTRITIDHTGSQRNSRHPSAVGSDLKIPAASNRVKRESVISTAATMRVLNVLRHWISKHSQDFENDAKLMKMTTEFLEELVNNPSLLPAEHKAASQLLQMITKEEQLKKIDLDMLLAPPVNPCRENFDRISAMEIAEAMTYLDHKIFISIQSGEFLGQAWMKNEKTTKAPHILLMTRRFNEVSRLVASEIMHACDIQKRVLVIEKWTAVADICRMLHNFNGVLQICAALTNSAIFRLKKTWDRISKTVKQTIEKLQSLVSTDGRFRNMREALHRCDPPCIPYLGMYLTDLSFIEEGTPNFTDDGLLNFSKMRMIAHVIREVKQYQQTPYKIEMNSKAINYLLDTSRHLSDDELYHQSLILEPRLSRLGTNITPTSASSSFSGTSPSHRDMS